jgi:murein DD-endopeptidase MepM/ murein hydrolase activator NlpD
MRYFLMFLLGLVAGVGSTIYFMRPKLPTTPPATASATPVNVPANETPKQPVRPPTEEELLAARVGMQIAPAQTPSEHAIADEPQLKEMPALSTPPNITPESILIPVVGVQRSELRSMFHERRGSREHRAIDIAAPRGTQVIASIDGTVGKLFLSKAGGITVYEYDPKKEWIYYYAHLDGYAPGLVEGQQLRRGDVIGFVGTSGNAPPNAPHLHFAIEKLTEPGRWWKSEPVDPYPLLTTRGVTVERKSK